MGIHFFSYYVVLFPHANMPTARTSIRIVLLSCLIGLIGGVNSNFSQRIFASSRNNEILPISAPSFGVVLTKINRSLYLSTKQRESKRATGKGSWQNYITLSVHYKYFRFVQVAGFIPPGTDSERLSPIKVGTRVAQLADDPGKLEIIAT